MRLVSVILVMGLAVPARGTAAEKMKIELAVDLPVTIGTVGLNLAPCLFRHRLEGVDLARRTGVEASLSFYSGHTSCAFAAATAGSYIFTLRHPDSLWAISVWLSTHALAATTGILRVQAGKHFWTDVLAGALAGSAFGLLIPWLHKSSIGEKNRSLPGVRQLIHLGWVF